MSRLKLRLAYVSPLLFHAMLTVTQWVVPVLRYDSTVQMLQAATSNRHKVKRNEKKRKKSLVIQIKLDGLSKHREAERVSEREKKQKWNIPFLSCEYKYRNENHSTA